MCKWHKYNICFSSGTALDKFSGRGSVRPVPSRGHHLKKCTLLCAKISRNE